MTLGPKFVCSSKMAVTRRRSKLWWRTARQSKALDETYLSTLSKRDLKPSASQNGLKEKIRDLSSSLNNFGPPPPFVCFALPKFFELLLKSRSFSFQSIMACRGSQKLHFGDLGLTQQIHLHCKLRNLVALQGQSSKKNGCLRIQGRMRIFG